MTRYRFVLAACAALVASSSLSACALAKITPEQTVSTVNALAAAGCKGSLHLAMGAQSAAGVSVGGAHVENTFDGSCDPANIPHAAAVVTPTP